MCYKPINMITPSQKISLYGGQQIKLHFGCGKCYECLQKKQLEYHYRTYYECQDVFLNGGYVMAVTLTYRPADVPRLSHLIDVKKYGLKDCMLFNYTHYQKFLKLLRIRLKRQGFKNVVIRYFLSSEYGSDPTKTHRPHYHLLLFVSSKELHPYKLSLLVSDCWKYGRTDGIPYKPMSYVRQYVFGYYGDAANCKASLLRVCNYVSKYVTKDSDYQKIIDSRISDIYRCVDTSLDGFVTPAFDDEQLKNIINCLRMQHKQSQGYGLGYLNNITDDEYIYMTETNRMRIPSSKDVVTSIPLPTYYLRKLYYKLETHIVEDDFTKERKLKYTWVLTEDGKKWKSSHLLKSFTESLNIYENYLLNMSDDDKKHIYTLLAGRELFDFMVYRSFFKGRLKYPLDVENYDLDSLSQFIVNYNSNYDDNCIYKYNSKSFYPRHFVTASKVPLLYDNDGTFCHNVRWVTPSLPFEHIDDFVLNNVYDENTLPIFENYDTIDEIFNNYIRTYGKKMQESYDSFENLKKRFKYIYNAQNQVINL